MNVILLENIFLFKKYNRTQNLGNAKFRGVVLCMMTRILRNSVSKVVGHSQLFENSIAKQYFYLILC